MLTPVSHQVIRHMSAVIIAIAAATSTAAAFSIEKDIVGVVAARGVN